MSPSDSQRSTVSRRRLLRASVAGAFALPFVARRSRAATSVSMTIDWVFEGSNSGFLIAREMGFYRDAGLDVTVGPGKGSGNTAQLVASKATQVGFADGYTCGNGISKGMAIKTIGSIFRKAPAAIIVLSKSSIKTPKDLESRTLGITAGSGVFQQWPAYVKGAKLDASKIKIVNIDPSGLGPALISGKVDAIGGYAASFVPSIEVLGKTEARLLWFADAGVNIVSNGIIAHNDLIKSDPDLLHKFVPASIKGFLYERQHIDEAVAVVKKYSPTSDPAIIKRGFEVSWKTWVTPSTKGKPLGWEADEDWASTIAVLKQYGGVTVPLTTSQVYTNEFVPSGAEYVPPQSA